jgi:hypothetical protein
MYIKHQKELDNIPKDYEGKIIILGKNIVVHDRKVILQGDAFAYLYGNSFAELYNDSAARLYENSSAVLQGRQNISLYDNSNAILRFTSQAIAFDNSNVILEDNSNAILHSNATAILYENATAILYGNSSAELYDDSSAVLYTNSSAELWGNSQVTNHTSGTITTHANSRIISLPQTIEAFLDFYGVKHNDTTAIMYKAVNKINGEYVSNYDSNFKYMVGESKNERCDPDRSIECSTGISIATLYFATQFGMYWPNLAILEVETPIANIVLPNNSNGKVRTSCVKVLREVPVEEYRKFILIK